MNLYRFDEVARAERYFVATLLTHYLMANNFSGLRKLFHHVYGAEHCKDLPEDFEVVTELDPLRDASVYNPQVRKLYQEFRRIAVPDIFLRWSNRCLIIEAKFFTDPSAEELNEQVALQREAVTKVKSFTQYKDYHIDFVILTVIPSKPADLNGFIVLSWNEVVVLMREDRELSQDIAYCERIVQHAIARAEKELNTTTSITFEKLKFKDLMTKLPQLIEQGKIYIGYTGGIEALLNATESELTGRSHYKISDIRWTDNWISLDRFLQRLFSLRGYFDKYDASTE